MSDNDNDNDNDNGYLEYEKDMDPLVEGSVRRRGLTGGTEPVDMRRPRARQVAQLLYEARLQGVGRVDPAEGVNGLGLHPGPTEQLTVSQSSIIYNVHIYYYCLY